MPPLSLPLPFTCSAGREKKLQPFRIGLCGPPLLKGWLAYILYSSLFLPLTLAFLLSKANALSLPACLPCLHPHPPKGKKAKGYERDRGRKISLSNERGLFAGYFFGLALTPYVEYLLRYRDGKKHLMSFYREGEVTRCPLKYRRAGYCTTTACIFQ